MRTATLGKILGGVGLLLLLSAPFTYFLTTGSAAFTGAKAALGVVLVGVFFATNYQKLGQFTSGRASFFVASTVLTCALALGALVAVNFIAAKRNKTWDLTAKQIYSLAPQTKSTLAALSQKVRAIAFIPEDHPDYDYIKALFEKYRVEQNEKFDYEFKNPAKNPDLAKKYNLKEGQNTLVLVRGEGADEVSQTLNVFSEQDLTNALLKLDKVGEQKAYFVVGHGEWLLEPKAQTEEAVLTSLSELRQSLKQESVLAEPLSLLEKDEVPRDASLVVIAGPKAPLTEPEVKKLEKYLEEGGRLVYFADVRAESGLDGLLAQYGVQVDTGLVADDRLMAGQNPYVPVSMFFGDHDITRVLTEAQMAVRFATVRALTVLREGLKAGVKVTPVVLSSPYAWVETQLDDDPEPSDGEKTGQLVLAAVSSRSTTDAQNKRFDEARVAVFGDSDLVIDGDWGYPANQNLVMNTLAWARNQANLITLRPPDRDISTIDLDDGLMARIRFFTTDLFPVTLLAVGLAIWLSRRDK